MANTPVEQTQAEYLERLRAILRRAPADIREDALHEVQTHIEDEWQALGANEAAMQQVLERLGPPEAYGRDLALQLMMMRGRQQRSPWQLVKAVIFWASTSLLGSLLVLTTTMFILYGLGMVFVALVRMNNNTAFLIQSDSMNIFGLKNQTLAFPPESWSPGLILLVGLVPAIFTLTILNRFLKKWVRSHLVAHGLNLFAEESTLALPQGWEQRAIRSMVVFALIGSGSCLLFTIISELLPIGQPGQVSLPQDFFRSPLTLLAFLSGLVFLSAPVLGLLWAARRSKSGD